MGVAKNHDLLKNPTKIRMIQWFLYFRNPPIFQKSWKIILKETGNIRRRVYLKHVQTTLSNKYMYQPEHSSYSKHSLFHHVLPPLTKTPGTFEVDQARTLVLSGHVCHGSIGMKKIQGIDSLKVSDDYYYCQKITMVIMSITMIVSITIIILLLL